MKLSLTLFGLPTTHYAPVAREAEAAGFAGVWLADHVLTPTRRYTAYPYSASGDPGYDLTTPVADVWSVAAAIAATTTTLRIGTGVYVLPLRPTVATASSAATVAALSGGRLLFGVGTGWLPEEFAALGARWEGRGRRTDEILDHITGIPIVVGGATPPALRRTAARGDGWYGPACSLAASVAARQEIERLRADLGRTGPFTCYVRLAGPATPQDYTDEGFDELTVPLATIAELTTDTLPQTLERVRRVADTLLP